jgi:hemerythrin superfamily protein
MNAGGKAMARRAKGLKFAKWGIVGGAIAAGAALIPLVPVIRRRAMRVTTILKKDHRMVSGLIMTLQMVPKTKEALRRRLFDQIRNNFMVHAQAEEEVLYPELRVIMFTDQSKVDEAYREHQRMKDTLSDLATMDLTSDAFDTKFIDFKNMIQHHVEEEESEIFTLLMQRLSTDEQEDLGRRIHNRKSDLKTRRAA